MPVRNYPFGHQTCEHIGQSDATDRPGLLPKRPDGHVVHWEAEVRTTSLGPYLPEGQRVHPEDDVAPGEDPYLLGFEYNSSEVRMRLD